MKEIVQDGHPVLREQAKEVPVKEIVSPKIRKIIDEMKESLASQKDGVAIAAPQIGYALRIFVVSGLLLHELKVTPQKGDDIVFINPIITKLSRKKVFMEEGCLSVRWLYGRIKRAQKATIKAYDERGNLFERGGSGLLAQIFQHETDHLNGTLFIDNAVDVHEISEEEVKAMQSR